MTVIRLRSEDGLGREDFNFLAYLPARRVYCEYRTRERIHRGMADPRLLAIPASRGRVAALDPNWGRFLGISSALRLGNPLYRPLYHECRPGHQRAMLI